MFIYGIRLNVHFFYFAIFAAGLETLEEPVVGAANTAFVAVEDAEGSGVVAEGLEGQRAAGFDIADRELLFDGGLLVVEFEVEQGGLDGGDAQESPAGGDEFIELVEVGASLRLEIDDVGLAEGAELLFGLVSEDGTARVEAVGDVGGVGKGPALGGFGPVRERAVGAG